MVLAEVTDEEAAGELTSAWEDEVSVIELVKEDKGLGFSILDFQVIWYIHFTVVTATKLYRIRLNKSCTKYVEFI